MAVPGHAASNIYNPSVASTLVRTDRRMVLSSMEIALVFPAMVGFRDWLDDRRERRQLDNKRDVLADRASDLAEAGLPDEVRDHLDRADEVRGEDLEAYREALDDVQEAIGRYRDLAGRHATLVERLRRARQRVETADPPFTIPFDRFATVLQNSDPTSPRPTELDASDRAFQNLDRIFDVVEGFDYGALDRLFPVEGGALAGTEPDRLYDAIEEPENLSALAEHLSDLAALVEALADADLVERSRTLEASELATQEIEDELREALRVGDPDRCARVLEEVDHAEELEREVEELRNAIDDLGWPTLEVDVSVIRDDIDDITSTESIGLTRQRLRFYQDAVAAVRDLNRVESAPYDVATERVREDLQNGFEEMDRETVSGAAKRASDLADVVEKADTVESMLEEERAGLDGDREALREQLEEAIGDRDLPTLNRMEERLRRVEETEWDDRDFFKFTPDAVVDLVGELWEARGYTVDPREERCLVAEDDGQRTLVRVVRRESGDATLDIEEVKRTAREARRVDGQRGVLVTNAGFTNRVRENAEKATPPVDIVDGEELAELLTDAEIPPPL